MVTISWLTIVIIVFTFIAIGVAVYHRAFLERWARRIHAVAVRWYVQLAHADSLQWVLMAAFVVIALAVIPSPEGNFWRTGQWIAGIVAAIALVAVLAVAIARKWFSSLGWSMVTAAAVTILLGWAGSEIWPPAFNWLWANTGVFFLASVALFGTIAGLTYWGYRTGASGITARATAAAKAAGKSEKGWYILGGLLTLGIVGAFMVYYGYPWAQQQFQGVDQNTFKIVVLWTVIMVVLVAYFVTSLLGLAKVGVGKVAAGLFGIGIILTLFLGSVQKQTAEKKFDLETGAPLTMLAMDEGVVYPVNPKQCERSGCFSPKTGEKLVLATPAHLDEMRERHSDRGLCERPGIMCVKVGETKTIFPDFATFLDFPRYGPAGKENALAFVVYRVNDSTTYCEGKIDPALFGQCNPHEGIIRNAAMPLSGVRKIEIRALNDGGSMTGRVVFRFSQTKNTNGW